MPTAEWMPFYALLKKKHIHLDTLATFWFSVRCCHHGGGGTGIEVLGHKNSTEWEKSICEIMLVGLCNKYSFLLLFFK